MTTHIDQVSDQAGERTLRRGRVSWLTHPPKGVARIEAASHAFHAIPVSVPEGDPVPEEATPGELLAISHAMFMASVLAEVLVENGTPADELVVEAECSFEGPLASRHLVAIDLSVHGRVPELDERAFGELAGAARRRYLPTSGARDDISGGLEAVLYPDARIHRAG
jgi:organic hydroperoxide reductase OsmC/OhrA